MFKGLEKTAFPTVIDAPRLVLKRHELPLAETMFRYVDRDRERLRQFLPWVDFTKSVQDEVDYINMMHDAWDKCRTFDYGLFRKSDGLYMGNAGVHTIAWGNRCCELGYWILGDFEGQGFMSEAVSALERTAFARGFHRVEIRCSPLNARSASLPKRCGYAHEATLKQNAIELGQYRDTLIFAKLNA